jgi:hypothetical protein
MLRHPKFAVRSARSTGIRIAAAISRTFSGEL